MRTANVIARALTRPRRDRPIPILAVGVVVVALLARWRGRSTDPVAVDMLTGSILIGLASYAAYASDRVGGEISARRGAIVGGLTALVWSASVLVRSARLGRSTLPVTWSEGVVFGLGLLLLALLGAGLGMISGVIGGRIGRAVGHLITTTRRRAAQPRGKPRSRRDSDWTDRPVRPVRSEPDGSTRRSPGRFDEPDASGEEARR